MQAKEKIAATNCFIERISGVMELKASVCCSIVHSYSKIVALLGKLSKWANDSSMDLGRVMAQLGESYVRLGHAQSSKHTA